MEPSVPVRCHPYPLNYPDLLELNCTHPGGDWMQASVEAGEWDSPALQLVEVVDEAAFWPYGTHPPSLLVSAHTGRTSCIAALLGSPSFQRTQAHLHTWSRWLMFDPLRSTVWDRLSVTISYIMKLHGTVHFNKVIIFWIRKRHVHFKSCKSVGHSLRHCNVITTCKICTSTWFLLF